MQRALALVLGTAFLVVLIATVRQPVLPWQVQILACALFGITVVRPILGLLVFAGLFPLGAPLAILTASPALPEMMLLAFLAAAGIRLTIDRTLPPSQLAAPTIVLSVLVAASQVLQLSTLQQRTADVSPFLTSLWRHLTLSYFGEPDFGPFHLLLVWLEALALAAFAELILRGNPAAGRSVVRMLVISGSALGAFSALRLTEISIRTETPLTSALDYMWRLRFNSFYADLNAAGSLFALWLVTAIWLAWRGRQWWAVVPALFLTLALWLAGSRAALAGAVGGLGLIWIAAVRPAKRTILTAGGIALILILVGVGTSVRNTSASNAAHFRVEMTREALRLTAGAPVFGIGLDNFRRASYENAHNNFLQIMAELGVVGLVAFVWLLVPAFHNVFRRTAAGTATLEMLGLAGGIAAFLLSALLGHPLLIEHIRAFFFLTLGIATGLSALESAPLMGHRLRTLAAAAGIGALIACIPFRVAELRRMTNLAGVVRGASAPDASLDDVTYRVAEAHSSWFVSAAARVVRIPLRVAAGSTTPCPVSIAIDGARGDVVSPSTDAWLPVELLFNSKPAGQSRRLDLHVANEGCTLLVGRLVERR
jgi:O-antigen ligase